MNIFPSPSFLPAAVLLRGLLSLVAASTTAVALPLDAGLAPYQPQSVTLSPDAAYLLRDGSIRIGGAEHAQVMIDGFNALFAQTHPGFRFSVQLKGTTTGLPLLTHGVTLFAPLGREVNQVELVPYSKIVGQAPVEIHVAHDSNTPGKFATSLAIYVNRTNPLERLTLAQASRIFSRNNPGGDFAAWSQLGLKGDLAKLAIHPYGTPESSGFGDYMQKHFLAGRPFAAAYEQFPNTEEILRRVGDDPAGIGFAAIGSADPKVKQVAIAEKKDGDYSLGSADDIVGGKYVFGRHLYFYVRREPGQPVDAVVKEYFRLILSREGQQIIAAEPNGYMPLTAAEAAAELAKLN